VQWVRLLVRFTEEIAEKFAYFATLHRFEDRKSFKENWTKWIQEEDIAELIEREKAILEQNGISNYLVEIGGEMRLKGVKPEQQLWKIAIEKPVNNDRAVQRILVPGDIGVATSGDYRNYFEENGIRYSHLLDPRTGKPINNRTVSVTVLHPSCMTADGYATALNVMDSQEALAFANQHDIAVLLVVKTDEGYTELSSAAFAPYLTQ
jgi:thiamine biosynthesis lipoprotein